MKALLRKSMFSCGLMIRLPCNLEAEKFPSAMMVDLGKVSFYLLNEEMYVETHGDVGGIEKHDLRFVF